MLRLLQPSLEKKQTGDYEKRKDGIQDVKAVDYKRTEMNVDRGASLVIFDGGDRLRSKESWHSHHGTYRCQPSQGSQLKELFSPSKGLEGDFGYVFSRVDVATRN